MRISFDPGKRDRTLRERGIDFADASVVFEGETLTFPDQRFTYDERRLVTAGLLFGRMVIVVWTPDDPSEGEECRRVISMRKANAREQRRFGQRLGEDRRP